MTDKSPLPFADMAVGDFVDYEPDDPWCEMCANKTQSKIGNAAYGYGYRTGKRFACRVRPNRGYRVTRVK